MTPSRTGVGFVATRLFLLLGLGAMRLQAAEFEIRSLDAAGQLVFNTLNNGTNYNYRVEWAPAPGGPWSAFNGAGHWLDVIQASSGSSVTSSVPMCYRVVATRGDYLVIDLSGGTGAVSHAVTYYPALADVPGGPTNEIYKTTKLLMRLIPKGIYTMSSPTNEFGREVQAGSELEVQHQVTLSKDFYMGVFEVTQKQWERVMGTWPSFFTNAAYRDSRPVEQVSYYEIRETPDNSAISPDWPQSSQVHVDSFVGRLRAKTGLPTMDLPTEAQWEYACRAGTGTALNSGLNLTDLDSCTNMAMVARYRYDINWDTGYFPDCASDGGTSTVGAYRPNAWGLYDMHGNVFEWCLDRYGVYSGSVRDPVGVELWEDRVMRGGCWFSHARYCRSAKRGFCAASERFAGFGFRLAVTLP